MRLFAKKHFFQQAWWLSGLIEVVIACRVAWHYLLEFLSFNINKPNPTHPVKTLVVAAPGESVQATVFFDHDHFIKRNVRVADPDIRLGEITTYDGFNEIVFVAGGCSYQKIIAQTEQYSRKARFWFTAAGSDSMVTSHSGKHPGSAMQKGK